MKKLSIITTENTVPSNRKNIEYVSSSDKAEGEYVLFTCGCTMDSKAAEIMLKADSDVVYCDEKIGDKVFYKPDYSPHTLLSYNYIGPCLIKRKCIEGGGTAYEILKRLSAKGASFCHIPRVLASGNRTPEKGGAAPAYAKGKVSIIIPSKDNYDILKRCVGSIREKSSFKDFEIIVSDNGSSGDISKKCSALADKYVYEKAEFNFSHMCNAGAKKAEGDFLIFLNDDTEIISPDWLEKLTSLACLENTGAVGAKLYYPNSRTIQHCGIINISNGPVHAFIGMEDSKELYFGRTEYNCDCIAVTAACLCIDKNKFKGFDEAFGIAYNDVDLCFSLYEKGLYNAVCNDALLFHHESLSRGRDRYDGEKRKRLYAERKRLYSKHRKLIGYDPFYSKGLTQLRTDFRPSNTVDRLASYLKNIRLVL